MGMDAFYIPRLRAGLIPQAYRHALLDERQPGRFLPRSK